MKNEILIEMASATLGYIVFGGMIVLTLLSF